VLVMEGFQGSIRYGDHIRTDKPPQLRIIIPALQVIHPCLSVVEVASVTEGVLLADGVLQASGNAQDLSPAVVSIVYYLIPILVNKGDHVILDVPDIEIILPAGYHGYQ